MRDADDAELLRLGDRNKLELQPLARESSLVAALRKVPGKWTGAMCEALRLPVSSRDTERKAAIIEHLSSPGSLVQAWSELPEPSRRIASWLVLEEGGSSSVRELYEEFGADDDFSYHWNKGELPTTALGLLRLRGLVFKGTAETVSGREKVAVVPPDLRAALETMARGPSPSRWFALTRSNIPQTTATSTRAGAPSPAPSTANPSPARPSRSLSR